LPQVKEWEFLVPWQGLVTIHLMPLKAWLDREPQDLVHRDLEPDPKVEPIAPERDQLEVEHAQVFLERSQASAAVRQEVHSLQEDQPEVAAAESVAELLEHSVKAEQEDKVRLESLNAPSEKNSNKEVSRVSVAQWCHAVTALPLFDFAAAHQFRTLPTRLMPMLAS
jgi:hypothetical protein